MTTPTPAWTTDELATLGSADEVQLAVRRGDGRLRRPVTIWIVRVGDDLFVRSLNGPSAVWYRSVREQRAGHLEAAGISRDVALEPAGSARTDQIDAAYRSKYGHHPVSYVNAVIAPPAREAALRLLPR